MTHKRPAQRSVSNPQFLRLLANDIGGDRHLLSPRRKAFSYDVQKYRDRATRRSGAVGGEPPMDAEKFREDFAALIELRRAGKIHPVVAGRLPLDEARHAHELLETAAAKGKIVLVP